MLLTSHLELSWYEYSINIVCHVTHTSHLILELSWYNVLYIINIEKILNFLCTVQCTQWKEGDGRMVLEVFHPISATQI